MSQARRPTAKPSASLTSGYGPLLADLKARVRAAQVRAALTVNRELVLLYWHIEREILRCQKAEGWGVKVVARLAADLQAEFPDMQGFSARTSSPCGPLPRPIPTRQSSNNLLDNCRGATMSSCSRSGGRGRSRSPIGWPESMCRALAFAHSFE